MAKKGTDTERGYTVTKVQTRWDPTVPPQKRIPRSIDIGRHAADVNDAGYAKSGPAPITYGTSHQAAQSGGPTERRPRGVPKVKDRRSI